LGEIGGNGADVEHAVFPLLLLLISMNGGPLLSRFNLFFALPIVAVTLPWVGLLSIHQDHQSYAWILDGWPYSTQPLIMYTAFLASFLVTLLALTILATPLSVNLRDSVIRSRHQGRTGLSLVLLALAFFFIFIHNVNPIDVIRGTIGKSDIRQTSAVTAVSAKYILPCIFAYACLTYHTNRTSIFALGIVGFLTFIGGLSLGGKTSAILVLIPGVSLFFHSGMKWRIAVILGSVAIVFAIAAGLQFDKYLRDGGIGNAASYLGRRAFVLTAQVPYQITQHSLAGRDFDYMKTLGSAATDAVLLHYVEPEDLYRYNFAKAVTARLYPNQTLRVASGRWNVTPTVFTEGYLAIGLAFYWLYAVIAAILVWTFTALIKIMTREGALPSAAALTGYFFFILNAWINSGGLTNLVHPLPLLSYCCAFIALSVIDRHPLVFRQRPHSPLTDSAGGVTTV
jgi:hypothetical protein